MFSISSIRRIAFGSLTARAFSLNLLTAAVFAPAALAANDAPVPASSADTAIRPFHAHFSDAQIVDLRKRIAATRWPDMETVSDRSQGAQLDKLKELVQYWGTDYDWRKAVARLNALPQYVTTIDGLDMALSR